MNDRELMQQALEALEVATTPLAKDRQEVLRAQAALRERLAQPEQEPVATVVARQYEDGTYAGNALDWAGRNCEDDLPVGTKLYTSQHPKQEQEPFCYHDGRNIVGKEYADHSDVFPLYAEPPVRRSLETEQKPVAWMWADGTVTVDPDRADGTWTPLYTEPRQWQGLTDEEVKRCYFGSRADFMDYARAIEAKLKEKNT